jgi:hypothetical protein
VLAEEREVLLLELEKLRRVAQLMREHVAPDVEPDEWNRSAVGSQLHSFYGGCEAILRQLIELHGDRIEKGGDWHRELLRMASSATPNRPPIISSRLYAILDGYRAFRHVYRST